MATSTTTIAITIGACGVWRVRLGKNNLRQETILPVFFKTKQNKLESFLDFSTVFRAYQRCAKGKKSRQCHSFQKALGYNLVKLHREIVNFTYRPDPARCFPVLHPKPREIWASSFRDRIVHHIIVEELERLWERSFHPKSFACRKGKGLHAAIVDIQRQVRKSSQGGLRSLWVLQLDLQSFFYTIDRQILKALCLQKVKDPVLRFLIELQFDVDPRHNFQRLGKPCWEKIIPAHKSWLSRKATEGIPIGNLTSQFGGNLYLNALDHWVSRELQPQGYLRYMDDLTLLHTDPKKLWPMMNQIQRWLATKRKQSLNLLKTQFSKLMEGVTFLGVPIQQTANPQQPLQLGVRASKKWQFVCEARSLSRENFEPTEDHHSLGFPLWHRRRQRLQKINARLGLLRQSASWRLRHQTLHRLVREQKSQFDENFALLAVGKEASCVKL